MSLKEQCFQPMYQTAREKNAEELKKLLAMANKMVDQNYLLYDCKVCHNIIDIDILEMTHLFTPVICPLTNWVMHMDETRYLWPCSGCTRSGVWLGFHELYCQCNIMRDCNPAIKMTKKPREYKEAYKHFSFHALCQNAISLLQSVAKQQGGHLFNLKEVLGDCMLELQDCDDILNLPKDDNCNHNMVMRKRMATQAELSLIQSAESPNRHALVSDGKVIAMAARMQLQPLKKSKQCSIIPSNKDTVKPSVRVSTKCATSKKINILSETVLGMVTTLESKKGQGGMKEALQKPKRH